ncbi:MAG: hypothetical protein EBZ48_17860, partial [Proteobacteria bacterium]|nr:hypothetical protein [Pseudomonadota bacterium]
ASAAALQKVSWAELLPSMDKEIRSRLGEIQQHCEAAGNSPFPFAKFLSAIPQQLCAMQFAALLLDCEPNTSEDSIAKSLGQEHSTVDSLLTEGSTHLSDLFGQLCPVMFRNWKAQLAGRVVRAQTLIEQHLISSLNKDFQILVAQVVLRAFGIKPTDPLAQRAQG